MPASCQPISSLSGLPAGHAKGLAKAKRRPAARIRGMPFMPDGGGARRSSTERLARAYTGRAPRVHGAAAVRAWDKRRVCTGRTPHANTQARVSRKFAGQQAFLPRIPAKPAHRMLPRREAGGYSAFGASSVSQPNALAPSTAASASFNSETSSLALPL